MSNHAFEAQFGFDELFFSQTDSRGIVLSGNSVFQRVSVYSWDELLGQPHSVVRHADMPRGVFYLFWDFLKKKEPIGAFVKNRSKDGRYYWVFALALPVSNRFVSVRLKPSGALLELIESEYKVLRASESKDKLSAEDSCKHLLARLQELGFSAYERFMAHALAEQIAYRYKNMNIPLPEEFERMRILKEHCSELIKTTKKILSAYDANQYLPLNLEIVSTKLGNQGRELSVVASRYQGMVDEIKEEIRRFVSMAGEVDQAIASGQFLLGTSRLLSDVSDFLKKDSNGGGDLNKALLDIAGLTRSYRSLMQEGWNKALLVIRGFVSTCESLLSAGAGLQLVRLSGKIEAARLSSSDAKTLDGLLVGLRTFQDMLSKELKIILEYSFQMERSVRRLSG